LALAGAGTLRYALAAVRKDGRGPFTDDEWDRILRLWGHVEQFARQADDVFGHPVDQVVEELAEWVRERRRERPFTDTEEALIVERYAAVQRYQDRLAERVRRLQVAESETVSDKASSGSDLLLTVISS